MASDNEDDLAESTRRLQQDRHWKFYREHISVHSDGYFRMAAKDLRQQVVWVSVPWTDPKGEEAEFELSKHRGEDPEQLRRRAIGAVKAQIVALQESNKTWEAIFFGYGYTQVDGSWGAMRMETFWVEEEVGTATTVVLRKKMFGAWQPASDIDFGEAVFPTEDLGAG